MYLMGCRGRFRWTCSAHARAAVSVFVLIHTLSWLWCQQEHEQTEGQRISCRTSPFIGSLRMQRQHSACFPARLRSVHKDLNLFQQTSPPGGGRRLRRCVFSASSPCRTGLCLDDAHCAGLYVSPCFGKHPKGRSMRRFFVSPSSSCPRHHRLQRPARAAPSPRPPKRRRTVPGRR